MVARRALVAILLSKNDLQLASKKIDGVLNVFRAVGFGGSDAFKCFVEDAYDPPLFRRGGTESRQTSPTQCLDF